jgi:hypothetical protein
MVIRAFVIASVRFDGFEAPDGPHLEIRNGFFAAEVFLLKLKSIWSGLLAFI